eukprot:COSAG04_NODE_21609_length_371_cov_0.319853_1_plen_48_part_10
MLSAASLCVVGYPLLMRYTTLEGEEAAVLEEYKPLSKLGAFCISNPVR